MSNNADYHQNKFAPKVKKRNVDLYKVIKYRPRNCTKDDIIKAARLYLISGNAQKVAREMKTSVGNVRYWMGRDWWPILLEEVNYLKNIELDGQYTHVLERSLEELWDRLENGDEVVHQGKVIRKRISARDAALVGAIMFDKRQLLRGDPTQIEQKNFDVGERLSQLQDAFIQLAARAEEKVIPGQAEILTPEDKESIRGEVKQINSLINLQDNVEDADYEEDYASTCNSKY